MLAKGEATECADGGLSVTAVVVAYRSEQVLPALVRSLGLHEPEVPLIIVDNGSPEPIPSLPAEEGRRIVVRKLSDNRGYGGACNAGAALAGAAGVYAFLNPDVQLSGPNLTQIAEAMAKDPTIGIATGPVVDPAGRRVPSAWGELSALRALWDASGWKLPRVRSIVGRVVQGGPFASGASTTRDEMGVAGHVMGGAMLVRRACFASLGGFDDGFFMYGEDADLCRRARERGWKVAVVKSAPFVHQEGTSSTGVSASVRRRWRSEGMLRYADLHLSKWQARRIRAALRIGRHLQRDR